MKDINAEERIFKVIKKSDIIIEVLDSRFIAKTRNKKYEKAIIERKKQLIICANKCELLTPQEISLLKKIHPRIIFVSAHSRRNIKKLRIAILIAQKKTRKPEVKVGVIGYANTGKSSVINALKGKHTARTAKYAGFTRGEQFFRISDKLLLIDSPGTIFDPLKTELDMFLINAKNVENISDPLTLAEKLIELIHLPYTLEQLAEEKGFKEKGGELNIDRAAIYVLKQYQNNKIRYVEIK